MKSKIFRDAPCAPTLIVRSVDRVYDRPRGIPGRYSVKVIPFLSSSPFFHCQMPEI
jgi:hypothetical protein